MTSKWISVTALLFVAAGCGDGSGPPNSRPDAELKFLRFKATAPPLVTTSVQFWAKKGEDREVSLFHRPSPGKSDSTRFLRFRVRRGSLDRLPGGAVIATGDSVLISITVIDPTRALVRFEPSGLRFAAGDPARLKFEFKETDDDLDGDGDDDANDAALRAQIRIWRQEQAGQPWVLLNSLLFTDLHEIEADIVTFTNYAVAF